MADTSLAAAMHRIANKAPCKGCNERHMGCHSVCLRYLRVQNARRWVREQERARHKAEFDEDFDKRRMAAIAAKHRQGKR